VREAIHSVSDTPLALHSGAAAACRPV
jgi:hypothetical protein